VFRGPSLELGGVEVVRVDKKLHNGVVGILASDH